MSSAVISLPAWVTRATQPVRKALAEDDSEHVFFILKTVCVMAFAASFILKGHGQAGDRESRGRRSSDRTRRRSAPPVRTAGPRR